MKTSALLALTGERGVGKTSFCRAVIQRALSLQWGVSGLISLPIFENAVKTGILVKDLSTNESKPLARAVSVSDRQDVFFDLPLGNWVFSKGSIAWGSRVIENILPSDLLIIDEIGPLELLYSGGWSQALDVLRGSRYKLGLVVVRPKLLKLACNKLPITQIITLEEPGSVSFHSPL